MAIIWTIITSKEAQRIKGGIHAFLVPLFISFYGLFYAIEYILAVGVIYNFVFSDREEARNSFNLIAILSVVALLVINAMAPVGGIMPLNFHTTFHPVLFS
jgi:hypothetical protein